MTSTRQVEHEIRINDAEGSQVFDLSQDIAQRHLWDPFASSIRLLDGATRVEVGAQVWEGSRLGIEMTAEYTLVDRPRAVLITMVRRSGRRDASRLLEQFDGEWRFDEDGRGVRVHMRYRHIVSRRWRWSELAIGRLLAREVRLRATALKGAVEAKGLCGWR